MAIKPRSPVREIHVPSCCDLERKVREAHPSSTTCGPGSRPTVRLTGVGVQQSSLLPRSRC